MKKTQTCRQYEPLVTPAQWQGAERRFALRLAELMDVLFARQGRMEQRLRALEGAQKGENNDE